MCFPSIAKNLLIVSAMIVPSADYGQHHEKNMKIFDGKEIYVLVW
jgi:hypothetical protein